MAVNMKLGVDLGSFNTGINQAKAQLKTFDAALKSAESQFKATGDAESALTTKMSALSSKLSTQKRIVDDYRRAMETMTKNNVDPLSSAFQKMQKEMLLAESAMYETQAALNELSSSEQQAATSADQLTQSVNGIGKKMSLDQVIGGINKITDGLENAAKKAVDFGATLFREIMEQAGEADDIMTNSMMYGLTPERYQAMTKLAATWAETSVEAIMKARQRVQNNIGDITDVLMGIGVDPYKNKKKILGTDQYTGELKNWEDIFWEAGDALLHLGTGYEQTQKAQEIFGRKWEELMPMFQMGREEYEKTLQAEEVNSAETIEKLAKLNDTVNALKLDFGTLEKEVLAGMAPALTAGAEALNGVLNSLLEYLRTPEGQMMLQDMETAVSGLFDDLGKIDPEQVVAGFSEVFTKITDGVQWLAQNSGSVVTALESIVLGWGALKLTGGALEIAKLFEGITSLTGAGAATAGASAGASWGAAFAAAVAKAAPWLVGAYALLKPAEGGNDSPFDNKTGMMTNEGWRYFEDYAAGRLTDSGWDEIINLVGERYGGLSDILGNPAAINAMAKALYGDHNFVGIDPKAQPDAYRTRINNELFDTLEGMGYVPKIEIEPAENVKETLESGTIELTVGDPTGRIKTPNGWKEPEVKVDPVPDEKAAEDISKTVGTVVIPAQLALLGIGGAATVGTKGVVGDLEKAWRQSLYDSMRSGYANGIPYVPNTRLAWLHHGERVLTAAQNRNYTANSNLYVEHMHMGGRMDAQALAEALSAQNRRTSAGFGQ